MLNDAIDKIELPDTGTCHSASPWFGVADTRQLARHWFLTAALAASLTMAASVPWLG